MIEHIQSFVKEVLDIPIAEAVRRDRVGFDIGDLSWSLGHTAMRREAECGPSFCFFTFSINDAFQDAPDIPDWIERDLEVPGATPCRITHELRFSVRRSQ